MVISNFVGNFGQENFQEISSDIFLMEYCVYNLETDTLTLPVLVSVKILTKYIELYMNIHEVLVDLGSTDLAISFYSKNEVIC